MLFPAGIVSYSHCSSIQDEMSETIIEDDGVTFTIFDGGSQKRTRVLISSLGYAYGVKVSSNCPSVKPYVRVIHFDNIFHCKCGIIPVLTGLHY